MTEKKDVKPEIKLVENLGIITGTDLIVKGGIPRTRKKVAIVGFAPASMRLVSSFFGDKDMEIWGLNQLYIAFPEIVPHCTRWFQFHARSSYDVNIQRDHSHHDWLAAQKTFPIYMQKQEPDVPGSIPLPKDLILSKFRRYFTNSISWEIAMAIHEGFEEIHIYGVDMAQDAEYAHQRPSCEYFIGVAEGAGIKVIIPDESDLMKSQWLYPYEGEAGMRGKIDARKNELMQRAHNLDMQEKRVRDERMQLIGAQQDMQYWDKSFCEQPKMYPQGSEPGTK